MSSASECSESQITESSRRLWLTTSRRIGKFRSTATLSTFSPTCQPCSLLLLSRAQTRRRRLWPLPHLLPLGLIPIQKGSMGLLPMLVTSSPHSSRQHRRAKDGYSRKEERRCKAGHFSPMMHSQLGGSSAKAYNAGYAKRYFVLSSLGLLSYSAHPGGPVRDQISLRLASISSSADEGSRSIHIDSGTATFHLKALSPNDYAQWMTALRRFCTFASNPANWDDPLLTPHRRASLSMSRTMTITGSINAAPTSGTRAFHAAQDLGTVSHATLWCIALIDDSLD